MAQSKKDIVAKLTELGIEHDPEATAADLKALLPSDTNAAKSDELTADDIEVGDPQLLRPVELPLVVKPANGGEWSNPQQAEYAQSLNAYAYRNPKKWAKKKDVLIARLVEIGKEPERLLFYKGGESGLSFKDKRIQA